MRENDHVTEDVTLTEGESHVRGGQFNRGRIVVMEVASLKKGEWLI